MRQRVVAHRRRNEVEEQLEIASGDAQALSVLQKHGRVVSLREEDETLQVRVRASRAGMGRILRALRVAERGALHA